MNEFRHYRILAIGACALSLVSLAAVAGPGKGPGRFMEFFDSNQDKTVTMSELNEASKGRFAKMDADGNSVVTKQEFQAYVGDRKAQWREKRFSETDANTDNQISKEEFFAYQRQQAEQHYQDLDANKDGTLSKEEYSSAGWGHRDGKHGHYGRGGERFFSKLDANKDSQLTLDESLAAWSNWFKRIDANNDQSVTEDEVKAFRDSMGR